VPNAVLTEDKKRAAYRALQDRILNGEGRASPEQRARAFSNVGLSQPLDGLLGKVATRPTQVTDADFAAARAAGFSEDELFELVTCAAVGQSAGCATRAWRPWLTPSPARTGNAP
jgi:hypothetical protein